MRSLSSLVNAGTVEVLHEFHACNGARLPFGTSCALLGEHGHDIIERAAEGSVIQAGNERAPGWSGGGTRVVTAPLERDGQRSATLAMHWIRGGPAGPAGEGLSAWLHGRLRLLPRDTGGEAVTELVLTARCDASPPGPAALDSEICARFLQNVVDELLRRAAAEPVRG